MRTVAQKKLLRAIGVSFCGALVFTGCVVAANAPAVRPALCARTCRARSDAGQIPAASSAQSSSNLSSANGRRIAERTGDGGVPDSIRGSWVIRRILPTTNPQGPPDSVKGFVGREVLYSSSEMRFGNDAFHNPKYITRRNTLDEFHLEEKVWPRDIGIKGQFVDVVQVEDQYSDEMSRPAATVYIIGPDKLATDWEGYVFEMVRKKRSKP